MGLLASLLFISAVLQSIWSRQTPCFHLYGGSLASIGYLLVAKIWHKTLLSFIGLFTLFFFFFASSFFFFDYTIKLTNSQLPFAGFVSYFWHLTLPSLLFVLLWHVLLVLLFASAFRVLLLFYMLWQIRYFTTTTLSHSVDYVSILVILLLSPLFLNCNWTIWACYCWLFW